MEDGTITKKNLADFKDFVRAELITHKETIQRERLLKPEKLLKKLLLRQNG